MKSTDIKEVENKQGSYLEAIFKLQEVLRIKYKEIAQRKGFYIPGGSIDLHNALHQGYLKQLVFCCISEFIEATECLRNKAWKQTEVLTDIDHFYEELVDALHFYVELCLEVGLTPQKLYELYSKKEKVNEFRIRSNY